jgi:hypothetical protein
MFNSIRPVVAKYYKKEMKLPYFAFKNIKCENCKHFRSPGECNLFKYVTSMPDRSVFRNVKVKVCRENKDLCGPDAIYFQLKYCFDDYDEIPDM